MTSSSKPMRKVLAIAGALSVIAGSFTMIPASFAANETSSQSIPGGQNPADECRHITVSATQYQGLPGQYQLAYASATFHSLHFLLLGTSADSDRWCRRLEHLCSPELDLRLPIPDRGLYSPQCREAYR